METQDEVMKYEIRIKGSIGHDITILFDTFKTEYTTDGDTVLRGSIIDQSELHGILMRIRDLGLTLLLVRQTEGEK
jgi:hypothetical protein